MKVHSHLFRYLSLVSLCQSLSSGWFCRTVKSRYSWSKNYAYCKPLHSLTPPLWSNLDTWQSSWARSLLWHPDLTSIVKQLSRSAHLRAILLFIRVLLNYRIQRYLDGVRRRKCRLRSRFRTLKSRFCANLRLSERISEPHLLVCHWNRESRDLLLWVWN